MTNKELQKWLKKFPANAEILWVNDWDQCEDGLLTGTEPLNFDDSVHVCTQTVYCDEGWDFSEEVQILIG